MMTNTLSQPRVTTKSWPAKDEPLPGGTVPFASATEAWFWTMGALRARRDGSGRGGVRVRRPCDPDDVVLCLDRLYRAGKIDLRHARILRIWGERQLAPDARHAAERTEFAIWHEALSRLERLLQVKGIVH